MMVRVATVVLLAVLVAVLVFAGGDQSSEPDAYDDSYEYYADAEATDTDSNTAVAIEPLKSSKASVSMTSSVTGEAVPSKSTRGFLKPIGRASVDIKIPMANEAFINEIVAQRYCVPGAQARLKSSEEEERLQKEEEEKKKRIVDPKMEGLRQGFNSEISAMMKSSSELKNKRFMAAKKSSQIFGENSAAIIERELNVTVNIDGNASETNETMMNSTASIASLLRNLTKSNKPVKKLRHQFRMNELEKLKKKVEVERIKDSKTRKFVLGPDCETMICGVCKLIVEEFAARVVTAMEDPTIRYVEQAFSGFCRSRNLHMKYIDLVTDVCNHKFGDVSMNFVSSSHLHCCVTCHVLSPISVTRKR
jgi:hypothetical protein